MVHLLRHNERRQASSPDGSRNRGGLKQTPAVDLRHLTPSMESASSRSNGRHFGGSSRSIFELFFRAMKARLHLPHALSSLCISSVLVGCALNELEEPRKNPDSTGADGGARLTSETTASDDGKTASSADTAADTSAETQSSTDDTPAGSNDTQSRSDDTPAGSNDTVSGPLNDGYTSRVITLPASTWEDAVDSTSNATTTDRESRSSTSSETLSSEPSADSSSNTSSEAVKPPEPELCEAGSYRANAEAACVPYTKCAKGSYVTKAPTATSDRGCTACGPGTYSAVENAEVCLAHTTCAAGSYRVTPGTAAEDTVCQTCPNGTFSNQQNAAQCTAHSPACGSTYNEVTVPSATNDRVCECQQTCGDGRCIAENACCEPTSLDAKFRLPTSRNNEVSYTFCIEQQVTLRAAGGSGGPPGETPPQVRLNVKDSSGTTIVSRGPYSNGSTTDTLEPGSYTLIWSVSSGSSSGSGGGTACLDVVGSSSSCLAN